MGLWIAICFLIFGYASAAPNFAWKQAPISSSVPAPRFDFSYAYDAQRNQFLVFGGQGKNGSILGDFFIYNTDTNQWDEVTVTGPSPRQDAAGVFFNNSFYVIGGNNGSTVFDEVWSFNVLANSWKNEGQFVALSAGSAINFRDQYLLYFGGVSKNQIFSSGVFTFHKSPHEQLTLPSSVPAGRTWFPWVLSGDSALVFGGWSGNVSASDLWVYEVSGNTWQNILQFHSWPQARSGHAMLYDNVGRNFLLFGGENTSLQGINDLWTFDSVSKTWTQLTPQTPLPRGRLGHGIFQTRSGVIGTFGGVSGWSATDEVLNDLWLLSRT